jgi:phage terminase large subunit-like protein
VTALTEPMLLGCQTPRFSSVPPYSVSLGDEAVTFAAKAGLYLDPWQQMVLRESMGMAPGGKWSAPQVGLLVPRQNGKGSVLEALELFHLFVLNTKLIVHSAHKFDTSQEHFLRMRTLIEGNPDLARHVAATPTANGKEAIILRNGNRLKFKARTISGAGRGFSSDLLILDEAMLLPEQALDAMMPTLTARRNPQVWFTSSAGTPESAALWRIVKRGRDKAPRLAYFEWGCESGTDVQDRSRWAAANPGFGYRLSLDALEDDFALLSEDGFAREHLGIWDDVASGIFPPDAWEALADPQAERGDSPVFAVATPPDRSWSAVAVAWKRPDGTPQVMLADYRPATAWVADRYEELRKRWVSPVLCDTASRGLIVGAEEPSQAEQAKAHNALSDAVLAGAIHHGNEKALNVAVRGARWKASGDTRVLDRKGSTDISPLVAAALAVHGLNTGRPSVYEDRGLITLG